MINHLPSVTYIYDRYHKSSNKQKATVEMRITYKGKQKYLSTGIMLYPNQWDGKKVINTSACVTQNKLLDKMMENVMQVIYKMYEQGEINIFSITNIQRDNEGNTSLKDFMMKRIEVRTYGKSKNTLRRYERFQKFFHKWGGIKTFSDITEHNIILYDKYLRKQGMNNCSKWTNYHRFLNSFIIDAIDEGVIKRNPYKWVNIDKGRNYTPIDTSNMMQIMNWSKSAIVNTTDNILLYYEEDSGVHVENININVPAKEKGVSVWGIPKSNEPILLCRQDYMIEFFPIDFDSSTTNECNLAYDASSNTLFYYGGGSNINITINDNLADTLKIYLNQASGNPNDHVYVNGKEIKEWKGKPYYNVRN